jgi:dCMP deaminase
MKERIDKISWYFKIAKDVALRSPCISRRRFGAILVKDDAIISTGYAGSVRGAMNCGIDSPCLKDLWQEAPYKSYEHCCSIHGEMNCIINAARAGIPTVGATLYLSEINDKNERPCHLCRRFIIQAGIKDVFYYTCEKVGKRSKIKVQHEEVSDWIRLENEWIQNEINTAPKPKKTGKCANCGQEKELVTEDDLCQVCLDRWKEGIG